MKSEKAGLFRRIIAYSIDIVVLYMLLIFLINIIPQDTKSINNMNNELSIVQSEFVKEEINWVEYIEKTSDLVHKIDRKMVLVNVSNALLIILLFVIVPTFKKGQTLGNILTKTKIIRFDEDNPSINDLIYRSILIAFLGHLVITLALIYILPGLGYFILFMILMILEFLLSIINLFMITYRYDKLALHDILTKTKVIKL